MKKPCRKCPGADAANIKETVSQMIKVLPAEQKVSEETYAARLEVCKVCNKLAEGTCVVCGCYAELRALKRRMDCPLEKW